MTKHLKEGSAHPFGTRRRPRQRRSQIVFDKIIATAKALFKQEGYAYVSTNRIAEKANISIGSLYQYFANREAIALAVYEDACSKAALATKRRTLENLSVPFEAAVPRLVAWGFDLFERDRYALLQLINEVPELRRVSQPISLDSLIGRTTQMFFEVHFPDIDKVELARKAYILDRCFMGIISRYLDDRPSFLNRSEAISEVVELIRQYMATLPRRPNTGVARSRGQTQKMPLQ